MRPFHENDVYMFPTGRPVRVGDMNAEQRAEAEAGVKAHDAFMAGLKNEQDSLMARINEAGRKRGYIR